MLLFDVNGTELVNSPWQEILSPFTDMLGAGFYLIPLTFVALMLYVKTRSTIAVSCFMLGSGILLASGSIFTGYSDMVYVYIIFASFGIIGVIAGLFFNRQGGY